MRQNVRFNGVEAVPRPTKADKNAEASTSATATTTQSKEDVFVAKGTKRTTYLKKGVEVNEGDAM